MPAQDQWGPKIFVIPCSGIGIIAAGEKSFEFGVNDAPRAKQTWMIGNVFFNFPHATKSPEKGVPENRYLICEFEISMLIGGVEVASQKFIELTGKESATPAFEKFHAVGSLEPYQPAVVYPGQDVRFIITLKKQFENEGPTDEGRFSLGEPGTITMNYTLTTPPRR